jgi:hypothetical protein
MSAVIAPLARERNAIPKNDARFRSGITRVKPNY